CTRPLHWRRCSQYRVCRAASRSTARWFTASINRSRRIRPSSTIYWRIRKTAQGEAVEIAGRGDDQRRMKSALKRQYHAALETLRRCVDQCPQALWDCDSDAGAPFWRVAYHTIFYTHFYLGKNNKVFEPWKKHRKGADNLGGAK